MWIVLFSSRCQFYQKKNGRFSFLWVSVLVEEEWVFLLVFLCFLWLLTEEGVGMVSGGCDCFWKRVWGVCFLWVLLLLGEGWGSLLLVAVHGH